MDELLKAALNGNRASEQELFRTLLVRFSAIAKQRVGDEEVARDLAQDAVITILEKYQTETFQVGFQNWAYGVLRMKIGNYFQSRAVTRRRVSPGPVTDDSPGLAGPPADPDLERRLHDCLRKTLKANALYATVLQLVIQGYKTEEISRMLNMERGHLYVALHRGRTMVKTCLETGEVK